MSKRADANKSYATRWALLALGGVLISGLASYASAAKTTTRFGHIWVIVMENKGYKETFGADTKAPYFGKTLPKQGRLLTGYYGTGHVSLDNYIAMVSGQSANLVTQSDCVIRVPFVAAFPANNGQFLGQGCIYPPAVKTVADQLDAKKISWRGYMQDLGNDPAREPATCGVPKTDAIGRDLTQKATAKDQYAARHDPFVYFHSVIDNTASCNTHVVNLAKMKTDLSQVQTTPAFNFITPNLCDDGHDAPCATGAPGGLIGEDGFLKMWIPLIQASPAYKKDGLIVITYDESEVSDATGCCGQKITPNTPAAGISGQGGGLVGAVVLSPKIKGGSVDKTSYDHFSLLRTIEDNFGLSHLGFAGTATSITF